MRDVTVKQSGSSVDVEFRLNDSETSYHSVKHDAAFLDEGVYDLFSACFASSVAHDNQFNYYGPTKYRRGELLALRSCLGAIETDLKSISSFRKFAAFFALENDQKRQFFNELNEGASLEDSWEIILMQLKSTNKALINLASRGIRESRTLWVLGL